MRSISRWLTGSDGWSGSSYSEFPCLERVTDPVLDRWLVIGGGIGLILSRVQGEERAARFCQSQRLFVLLRTQLKHRHAIKVPPELLAQVMQEVSGVADPMTLVSLRMASSHRSSPADRKDHEVLQRPNFASRMRFLLGRAPSVDPATLQDCPDTQLGEDIFQERFSDLRRAVASARATGFGEPR